MSLSSVVDRLARLRSRAVVTVRVDSAQKGRSLAASAPDVDDVLVQHLKYCLNDPVVRSFCFMCRALSSSPDPQKLGLKQW